LLHQVIKGTFKDHLVTWVGEYLILEHGEGRANEILDDIDRRYVLSTKLFLLICFTDALVNRIAAAPLFSNLRRFPHGRRFKQWTGDDSKALMKVSLRFNIIHYKILKSNFLARFICPPLQATFLRR
jgi:hypothetical protein